MQQGQDFTVSTPSLAVSVMGRQSHFRVTVSAGSGGSGGGGYDQCQRYYTITNLIAGTYTLTPPRVGTRFYLPRRQLVCRPVQAGRTLLVRSDTTPPRL